MRRFVLTIGAFLLWVGSALAFGPLGGSSGPAGPTGPAGPAGSGLNCENVQTDGAKGDATTNDAPAFQAAINNAKGKGNCVYIPPLTNNKCYLISTSLNATNINGLTIFSNGSDMLSPLSNRSITPVGASICGNTGATPVLDLTGSQNVVLSQFSIDSIPNPSSILLTAPSQVGILEASEAAVTNVDYNVRMDHISVALPSQYQSSGPWASITNGTNTLSLSGSAPSDYFTHYCVESGTASCSGKAIIVYGAGTAGANLSTTISSVTDGTHVVLAANASTTVTNVLVQVGPLSTNPTFGLYQSSAQNGHVETSNFEADYPYVFTQTNPFGLTSPYQTVSNAQSAQTQSMLDTVLISWGQQALWLDGGSDFTGNNIFVIQGIDQTPYPTTATQYGMHIENFKGGYFNVREQGFPSGGEVLGNVASMIVTGSKRHGVSPIATIGSNLLFRDTDTAAAASQYQNNSWLIREGDNNTAVYQYASDNISNVTPAMTKFFSTTLLYAGIVGDAAFEINASNGSFANPLVGINLIGNNTGPGLTFQVNGVAASPTPLYFQNYLPQGSNPMIGSNNLSELTNTGTGRTNLGVAYPTLGSPGNYSPLEQIVNHSISTSSATLACKFNSGSNPGIDYYSGTLSGANVTYDLPSGCLSNSQIWITVQQDTTHTVTFTSTGTNGIEGQTCPALGTSVGNTSTWFFTYNTGRNRWREQCGPNNPNTFAVGMTNGVLTADGAGNIAALAGNTLSAHNFGTSISAAGVLSGAQPADADISFTDITTGNSATAQHGFLKKLDNTATHYMDGTGNWSTPPGTAVNYNEASFITNRSTGAPSTATLFGPVLKLPANGTAVNFTVTSNTLTGCSPAAQWTLYDCGTSAPTAGSSCTTAVTNAVTLALGEQDATFVSTALTSGHYLGAKFNNAGTSCTAVDVTSELVYTIP